LSPPRWRAATPCRSLPPPRPAPGSSRPSDLFEPALERKTAEGVERQIDEQTNAALELRVRFEKGPALFFHGSLDRGGILHTPVRGHRPAGPERTRLRRRLIANREYKMHERRARPRKFAPVLAAQPLRREAIFFQQLEGERIYAPGRLAAGAESFEFVFSNIVEKGLGQDAARRVAGAEKKHVESFACHERRKRRAAGVFTARERPARAFAFARGAQRASSLVTAVRQACGIPRQQFCVRKPMSAAMRSKSTV